MDRDPGRTLRIGQDVGYDGTPFNSGTSYSTPSYSRR
jgi:hypothetical protein